MVSRPLQKARWMGHPAVGPAERRDRLKSGLIYRGRGDELS